MKLDYLTVNVRHWLLRQPAERFVAHYERVNRMFLNWPVSVTRGPHGKSLVASEAGLDMHFCHVPRASRYSHGIGKFLDDLQRAYLLDNVKLSPGDWVLDCGANVGEVSKGLLRREPSLQIIAVEPEAPEADCADLNLFDGQARTVREALWHEEKLLTFYSASPTADSSAIEPRAYVSTKMVRATTIDLLLNRFQCPRLRLLKLEAEGAEPEILEGARDSLSRIDYIAADLGPERGLKEDETATPVINMLLAKGFDLVAMRFDRVVALFRNRLAPIE